MKDSTIKTKVSLIFTNDATKVLNYPYSRTYLLGTKNFTIEELRKYRDDLTTKDSVDNSCFSNIDFSYTLNTQASTEKSETSEKSEAFIFAERKDQKKFKCGATSIADCAYNIQHGKCPRKQVYRKLFELFHQNEHN